MKRLLLTAALTLTVAAAGTAQTQLQKAVALAGATIYINPDTTSAHLGALHPGDELAIQSASGDWAQIFSVSGSVSGWIPNHGYARYDDPDAPLAIFGDAVQFENTAESASGQDDAANTASRLYLRIYNDFPASPLAAESLYRGANIRWQLQLSEEPPRRTPKERLFPDDTAMRRVISKYSGSVWAQRAEYYLLVEHFTCGDWYDKPECVEKEAGTYDDFVKKFPQGPMTAEAEYDALYRDAIAWTLYSNPNAHHDAGKVATYKRAVLDGAARMRQDFPNNDWTAQAALLAFNVAAGVLLTVPATPPMGGP